VELKNAEVLLIVHNPVIGLTLKKAGLNGVIIVDIVLL
jgi:hypothetical protein